MARDSAEGTTRVGEECDGLRWAAAQAAIPEGVDVQAARLDDDALRPALSAERRDELRGHLRGDGFAICPRQRSGGWVVTGLERRSVIYGLLELGRCLRQGDAPATLQNPSFDLRVYKFELGFADVPAGWICAACDVWGRGLWYEHADGFWTGLVREMSKRRLNALVLWTISPFEHWIWNERFPGNRVLPREHVERNHGRLTQLLRTADEYGVDVHFQYYVGHCGHRFADEYGVPAGTDASIARRYTRYAIETLLDEYELLAGIWLNSEKMKNSADFVRECVVEPLNRSPRRRTIVQRLWGIRDPEGMTRMMAEHDGRTILAHKTTWDWEYQPIPDPRFARWRELVPGAEMLAMWGPCHTTGAAGMTGFWADPQFIWQLLRRLEDLGVRHVSFNTVGELLGAGGGDPSFTNDELRFARCNRLHVDAVARYAWRTQEPFDPSAWARHLAERWSLRGAGSPAALLDLYRQTSNIHNLYGRFLGRPHVDSWWDWPWRHPLQAAPVMTMAVHGNETRPGELPLCFPALPSREVAGDDRHLSVFEYVDGRRDGRTPRECVEGMLASAETAERDLARIEQEEGRRFDSGMVRLARSVWGIGRTHARLIEGCLAFYCLYTADRVEQVTGALEQGLAAYRQGLEESRALRKVPPRWFSRTYHNRFLTPGTFATEIREWSRLLRCVRQHPEWGRAFLHFLCSCRHVARARQWVKPRHVLPPSNLITAQAELEAARRELERARSQAPAPSRAARNLDALHARAEMDLDRLSTRSIRCPKVRGGRIEQAMSHRYALRPDDALRAGGPVQWEFLEFFDGPRAADVGIDFAVCRDDDGIIVDIAGRFDDDVDFDTEWHVPPETFMQRWLLLVSFDTAHDHAHSLSLVVQPDGSPPLCVKTTLVPDRGNLHVVDETREGWSIQVQATGPRTWHARAGLPFSASALGRSPAAGEIWGFDLACRPRPSQAVEYHFNATFESWGEGNVARYGHLVFD